MGRKVIRAPWTEEQVNYLKGWQCSDEYHSYTCGGKQVDGKDCRADLIPTINGWKCPECQYAQDWFIIYE